jgi:hypothetical protein
MALNSRYQVDVFRDAGLAETQTAECEQRHLKALLAELMLLVIHAEAFRMNQEKMDDE